MRETQTRVTQILEAQKDVDRWADLLATMAVDDPRFDGSLEAYEDAIERRRQFERGRFHNASSPRYSY